MNKVSKVRRRDPKLKDCKEMKKMDQQSKPDQVCKGTGEGDGNEDVDRCE